MNIDKQQTPVEMKCLNCGNEWNYKGARRPTEKYNIMITCPNCYYKVKLGMKEMKGR